MKLRMLNLLLKLDSFNSILSALVAICRLSLRYCKEKHELCLDRFSKNRTKIYLLFIYICTFRVEYKIFLVC